MKILVLVFYIILFSATVVDLTAATTAAATKTTATTTTATISSSSSTSTKKPLTQPLSTLKEAHGTSSYCRCPDGTTIALSGLSTTTGKHAESPPVLTNTTGAIVNRTPTSSIKPNTTLMNTKSRTTLSSIKPSTTSTNTNSNTTSSSTNSRATPTNTNSSTTTSSTNSRTTPTNTNSSTTTSSTNSRTTPTNTNSSTTSSSTNLRTTPTNTNSSTTTSSTNSRTTPTNTNWSTTSSSTNSRTTPTSAKSSTTPTSTTSSTTPTSTTSSTTPTSTTSSTTPTSTTSSTTPTSTTSSTTPTSTTSSTTPTSTTSSTTPTSTTSSTTPTSTTSSTTPKSTTSSTTPKSTKQSNILRSIKQSRKASNLVGKALLPASKAGSHAKRERSDNKKSQGNSIIVNSTTILHHTTPATTDNTTMVTSQDTTDHGTGTEQHIYTTIVNPRCSEICQAHSAANATISAVDSTTVPKQATKPSIVMHPDIAPKWDDVQLDIPLVIVINETFTSNLEKQDSDEYRKLAEKFQTKLQEFYSNTPHFEKIVIKRFSNGSIKCEYSVVLNTNNLTKTSLDDVIEYIRNNRTNEAELNTINGIGQIEVSKTMTLMTGDLSKAKSKFNNLCETYGDKMCEYDHKCIIKNDQYETPYCVYKCNTEENRCGEHGTCSVDEKGKIACKCKEDPLYVFHGERCDIKEEKLLLSKNYIIAIAAGGGGAVILLLFIAMICLCRKWNKANKASQFYRNRSTKSPRDRESVAYEDDKGIQMENSRIENVYMSEHGHENNGFAVDSAAPSADGSSMRYEKGRYYRVVKDPELGSDTLIYQPSNLNRPIQRESTISKDQEPDPLRSHYDYIDTDTVYKIKRPNVRSNTIDSNGHPRTAL